MSRFSLKTLSLAGAALAMSATALVPVTPAVAQRGYYGDRGYDRGYRGDRVYRGDNGYYQDRGYRGGGQRCNFLLSQFYLLDVRIIAAGANMSFLIPFT